MSIGKIKEFDVVNGNWRSYCDRLKMYFTANAIKDDLHLPTLISIVGDETYELMVNLTSPKEISSLGFTEVVRLVEDHLQPRPSEMAERYRFRQRRQMAGENVARYVAELKRLSRYCEFGASLDANMRDQLVCGLTNDVTRQRLFSEEKLTFAKALKLAVSLESAEKNSAAVEGGCTQVQEELHALTPARKVGGAGEKCAVCGSNWHATQSCRFKNYICSSCHIVGHLRRVCPRRQLRFGASTSGGKGDTTGSDDGARAGRGRFGRSGRSMQGGRQNAHFVTETKNGKRQDSGESSASEEEAIYQMSLKNYPAVSIPICIEDRELLMEIDTGCPCACISEETYYKLFSHIPLQHSNRGFKSYNGSKIQTAGLIRPKVKYGELIKSLDLYVVERGTTSLLGRQWLAELGVSLPMFKINNVIENCTSNFNDKDVTALVNRYAKLFDGSLGRYTGGRARLHVRADATPVYCRARPLPYALRDRVDAELDEMLKNGTIEPVEFSEWATPLVPVVKPNGKIRVCADFKITLNPALLVDRFPMPRVDDLFAELNGGEQFTKIDLSAAYNQLELDEASKVYTVINTHRGLFKYNRLVYGLASSPGIFQRTMISMLRDIPGVAIFADDLLISGKSRSSHMKSLQAVFEKLSSNGLKLNKDKCVFFSDSVSYLGYIINKKGIQTDPEKVKAIVELPRPTNVPELRSFLGFVNFYARFIKNLSSHLAPLHQLLKKSSEWVWSERCETAFNYVKNLLTSAAVLRHYNQNEQLILTCDASACGIGAVLSQPAGAGDERPVAYASRSLSPAERHYSQIQREALAIIFAVKKFHQYLYGRQFLLRTDHKPLVSIFGPKAGVPTMAASRLQRWAIILSAYDFKIEYVRTNDNGADGLSRLPITGGKKFKSPEQTFLHFARDALLIDHNVIRKETMKDPILGRVFRYVTDGWPSTNDIRQLQPYFNRRNEIYLELGCLMWGHRVIIPEKCKVSVLKELHETHMGMMKMKSLARSYVWWAGIDEAVEAACRACETCATHASAPPANVMRPWAFSDKPWRRIHLDFLGPISGMKFLIVVDSTSKWIETFKMNTTNAAEVIKKLRHLFSQFGLPRQIVSDNGPPFSSEAFKLFLSSNGIEQSFTAPYHPSSNGAAENAVKLCKSVIKKAISDQLDIEIALDRFLLLYRATEHGTTGESPAKILQGRSLKTRLDAIKPSRTAKVLQAQHRQVEVAGGGNREFRSGDQIYLRNYRSSNEGKWAPGEVVERLGSSNYKVRDSMGTESHRHIDQLRRKSRGSLTLPIIPGTSGEEAASRDQNAIIETRNHVDCTSSTPSSSVTLPISNEDSASRSDKERLLASPNDTVCENPPLIRTDDTSPIRQPSPSTVPLKRTRYPVKRYGLEFD